MLVRAGFVIALLAGVGVWAGIIPASASWVLIVHIAAGLAVVVGIWAMAIASGKGPARARPALWAAAGLVVAGALIGLLTPVHRDPWLGAGHLAVMVVAVGLAETATATNRRLRS